MGRIPRISIIAPAVVMFGLVAVLFFLAPRSEDFWWTDSASFALNGELIHDYIMSGLHQSPVAFANDWFRRYPALTISLYPPLFPIAEAIAFTLFGFSHPVAQAVVAAFAGLAAFGAYRMAKPAVGLLTATAGGLLMFAAPGILLWSRQVMMEIPSLAFLLLASGWFLDYLTNRRTRDLMLATLLVLAAVYTKQNAIFVAPALIIALVVCGGWRRLRDRSVWIALAIAIVGLVPLALFTLIAGRETLQVALGNGIAARATEGQAGGYISQAATYGLALPEIVGWPLLLASAGYLVVVAWRGWRTPAEKHLSVLMLAWFATDFLFISVTAHFELRYAMALGVPCAMLAILLISRLFGEALRPWIALSVGTAVFVIAVRTHPVFRMSGYDKVAAYILDHSLQDDVIWFQGNESKNLVFSLRSHSSTPKVFVLRAEKFLVDYHIVREWGVEDRGWTAEKLHDLVDRYGIKVVVLQPDFWSDLPSMGRMQDYIQSDRFKEVVEFPITADEPSQRATIKIFVNQQPTVATAHP